MKRFFKPIEKDGSSKKPTLASPCESKCDGETGGGGEDSEKRREPIKFLTWNANSLLLRVKNNWPEFSNLIQTLDPDIVSIQEVRMPAAGSKGGPKNPSELKDDTSTSREEKQVLMRALSSPPFGNYRVWWSLSDSKYGGTALFIKKTMPAKKGLIHSRPDSHQDIDVSHPDFFSNAKLSGYIPPNKEDCGQPGFTLAERRRFSNILSQGKLIDAYRFLHKEQDMERGFSWSGNPIGKYRGKRMRIDYFLVSEKLTERIIACEMHGQGIELQGFYGSDHCPVSLELAKGNDDPKVSLEFEEGNDDPKLVLSEEH